MSFLNGATARSVRSRWSSPSNRSYPLQVPTTGEAGNWTLDTHGIDPCGYVLRLYASDRTNVNSTGNAFDMAYDVGFCLEPAR